MVHHKGTTSFDSIICKQIDIQDAEGKQLIQLSTEEDTARIALRRANQAITLQLDSQGATIEARIEGEQRAAVVMFVPPDGQPHVLVTHGTDGVDYTIKNVP